MALLNNKNFKTPIEVIENKEQYLIIRFIEKSSECAQCQSGKGCGANPWFKGLFKEKSFTLKKRITNAKKGQHFELILAESVLKKLILLQYALPLSLFIIALSLSQTLVPWQQASSAFFALFIGIKLSEKLKQKLLQKYLQLQTIDHKPQINKPLYG